MCLRCFEANDDAFPACQSCGLARGERPASDDAATPGTPAAAAGQPAGSTRRNLLGILARFWWVIPIAVIGLGGLLFNAQRDDGGEITRSGDLAVTDLQVGDCFDVQDDTAEEVDDVTARPCSEPHQYEMMFVGDLPEGDYPSDAAFEAWLDENCLPAFSDYVGTSYQESALEILWFQPTEDGWDEGDHSVQCAVYDPSDNELTASLRGSNR
ncbi:MAG TPA: septum formation family protein [Candidatus Limnocylindria bacterium]|nr:septum formation family protein [Candidatus Limnocylindria bacterium]